MDVQEQLLSGRFVEGRGRRSHTSVCGRRWVWSGIARDHYASEISDRKHRSGIDRYMKARSHRDCIGRKVEKKKISNPELCEASQTKLFTCACRVSEIKDFDQREFFSFSFVVELYGKLVILMTTYQIFISNYGKIFYIYHHVGKKYLGVPWRGFFYFSFILKLLLLLPPTTVLHRSHQRVGNMKKP